MCCSLEVPGRVRRLLVIRRLVVLDVGLAHQVDIILTRSYELCLKGRFILDLLSLLLDVRQDNEILFRKTSEYFLSIHDTLDSDGSWQSFKPFSVHLWPHFDGAIAYLWLDIIATILLEDGALGDESSICFRQLLLLIRG